MQKQQHTTLIILTLMITIIIDIMGVGLILPTLAQLFLDPNSVLTSQYHSENIRNLFFGLSLAAWPLGLLIGGPMLGHLSDEIGRRRIIAGCLLMTAVTYALAAVSIDLASVWLFIAARFLSGIFAGSFELAQAVIADVSTEDRKARNMGWITLSASLGFVVGPLLSGITTDPSLASWFSLGTPFWCAAGLSFINMISILILLKETYIKPDMVKIDIMACVKSIAFIVKDKRVRYLGLVFCVLQFGWAMYMYSLTAVLHMAFNYEAKTIGIFFAVFGAGFGIGTILVQPLFQKWFSLKIMSIVALLLTCIIQFFAVYPGSEICQWLVGFFAGMFEVLAYTGCIAMLSNAVSEKEQGTVLGGAGSLFAFAWMISSFAVGPAIGVDWRFPIAVSAVVMLITALMLLKLKEKT